MNKKNFLHPGENMSLWVATVDMPSFSSLTNDHETDVCIVGGGIAGLTTAYLLQKEGKKICILEDNEVGSGQTAKTTAHFVTALDDRYFNLEKFHGAEGSKLAAKSHRAAIRKVEEIVKLENISCDLEKLDGFLYSSDFNIDILNRELQAVKRAGLRDVHLMDKTPLPFETGPALRFPEQMQLHPLKYLKALAELIVKNGGRIFSHTHVKEVHGGGEAFVVTSAGCKVHCNSIVVATNSPINNLFAIHTKQAAYRTYVIAAKVPKGSVSTGLYWDTHENYHYVRIQRNEADPDTDLLVVGGGEDHKTGQDHHPLEHFDALESWTIQRFPMAKEVVYAWSGQVMEPVDGLAYLGHNPMDKNNVYVITGDSGNGMTHCTIGAMIVCDQIMGRKNPWEELYNPSRIRPMALKNFLKENANTVAQYGDWFMEQQYESPEDIPAGEGALFREGFKIIAAHKTEDNNLEFMSATCTHLGGVVNWNSTEKSWDCPCHGSRFDAHGKVIEGPATSDLKPVKKPSPIPIHKRQSPPQPFLATGAPG